MKTRTTHRVALILVSCLAAVGVAVLASDPPYPEGLRLVGSSSLIRNHNTSEDPFGWKVTGIAGGLHLGVHGLSIDAATAGGQDTLTVAQYQRVIHPEAGKRIVLTLRLYRDHILNNEALVGLLPVTQDPFGSTPANGAYFYFDDDGFYCVGSSYCNPTPMPPCLGLGACDQGSAEHYAPVRYIATNPSSSCEPGFVTFQADLRNFDYRIEIEGTDCVQFCWKEPDLAWSEATCSGELTSCVPEGDILFTAAFLNHESSLGHVDMQQYDLIIEDLPQ
jgi:hypothetical protein